MNNSKLEPCPHCGGEVTARSFYEYEALRCDNCGMIFALPQHGCGRELHDAFNRRATLPDNKALTPKITIVSKDIGDVSCRKCGHLFFRCFRPGIWNETQKRRKFCINCGQKLDWSDCRPPETGD